MDIEKDCFIVLLLFILFYFIFRHFALKREISIQNEYFIKTLWHDIRIPIIAQINGLSFIKNNGTQNVINNNLIKEIESSCNYTLDMIKMLMQIYEIEKKHFNIKYEKIYPRLIIAKILNNFKDIISEKNINVKSHIESECIFIDSDNFINLIKILLCTAIQYSKKNGVLEICLFNNPDNILNIEVKYIGMSISGKIYKYNFRKNLKYSTVGHGIQMYLCKKIVDLYKGKCEFKTENNQNSFNIKMPNLTNNTTHVTFVDAWMNYIFVQCLYKI